MPDLEKTQFIFLKRRSFKPGIIQQKLYGENPGGILLNCINNRISMKRSFKISLFLLIYEPVMIFLIHSRVPVIKLLQQEDEGQARTYSQEYQIKMKLTFDRNVKARDLQVGYLTLEWHAPRLKKGQQRKFIKLWMGPLSSNDGHRRQHLSPSHSRWRRRIWDPGKREVTEDVLCIFDSSRG